MSETEPRTYCIALNESFSINDVPSSTTAFDVAAGHPEYSVVNGLLLNKEGVIIALPPMMREVTISDVKILKSAFTNSHVTTLSFINKAKIADSFASMLGLTDQLECVKFGDGVVSIGNQAFANCKNLKKVFFSDTMTSIGAEAFRNCTSLTEIIFPESITEIGNDAFRDCKGLSGSKVIFHESIKRIGSGAFHGTYINEFEFKGVPDSLSSQENYAINDESLEKIIIPKGTLKQFKRLLGWFSHRFRYPSEGPTMDSFVSFAEKDSNLKITVNVNYITYIDATRHYNNYYIYILGKDKPFEVPRVNCIDWINRILK